MEWLEKDGQRYFAGDEKEEEMASTAVGAMSVGWCVVDVAMDHKTLATLYPYHRSSGIEKQEDPANLAVANHVLLRILS